MKILLVDWTWGIHGGPEEFLMGINLELVSRGEETRIVQEGSWKRLFIETQKNLYWADLVICFAFPASLMVGLTKKPCMWICYDVPEAFYKWHKVPAFWGNKQIWNMSNRQIICSNVTDAYSLETIYHRKVDAIIPLAVDSKYFSHNGRLGIGDGIFRLCQVGTILRNKNQLETIDIFRKFLKEVPNSQLVLAGPRIPTGSGPAYWDACINRIVDYEMDGKVHMPGHYEKDEVRGLYTSWANVYMNNLRGTGGWLAVLEAMSTGLPVVSSKWFFGWEYLYPFAWVGDNILEGLLEVYNNYELYKGLAEQGSKWISENLTYKKYVDKLMEVISAN